MPQYETKVELDRPPEWALQAVKGSGPGCWVIFWDRSPITVASGEMDGRPPIAAALRGDCATVYFGPLRPGAPHRDHHGVIVYTAGRGEKRLRF